MLLAAVLGYSTVPDQVDRWARPPEVHYPGGRDQRSGPWGLALAVAAEVSSSLAAAVFPSSVAAEVFPLSVAAEEPSSPVVAEPPCPLGAPSDSSALVRPGYRIAPK